MQLARTLTTLATTTACAAACAALFTRAAAAQETSGNGFLFGAPSGSVTVRAGYAAATAGSDLFSFATSELTLRRGDFGSFAYGADLAFALRPRWDLVFSADVGGMDKKSEYREWQDNSGNAIEQSTSFSRQSYAASAKYYFMPYGRTLGRFAWIPSRFAPWASGGLGRTLYRFKQVGDFIDFDKDNQVFNDTFVSSKWANTAQIAAGLDWNIDHRWALTSQLKYLLGSADLGLDFSGFAPIDLSGLGMTAGLTIRF